MQKRIQVPSKVIKTLGNLAPAYIPDIISYHGLHRPLPVLEQATFVPISGLLDLLLCLPEVLHPHLSALLASGVRLPQLVEDLPPLHVTTITSFSVITS